MSAGGLILISGSCTILDNCEFKGGIIYQIGTLQNGKIVRSLSGFVKRINIMNHGIKSELNGLLLPLFDTQKEIVGLTAGGKFPGFRMAKQYLIDVAQGIIACCSYFRL